MSHLVIDLLLIPSIGGLNSVQSTTNNFHASTNVAESCVCVAWARVANGHRRPKANTEGDRYKLIQFLLDRIQSIQSLSLCICCLWIMDTSEK